MQALPLDRGFNVAVNHIASRLFPRGFDVAADAPETFEALKAHVAETRRMKVWNGASERTIFADPETNYAFRAWHDWCHLAGGFEFTPEGEAAAVALQQEHIRTLYGETEQAKYWVRILDAEVNGQLQYAAEHGDFPADQFSFVKEYLSQA